MVHVYNLRATLKMAQMVCLTDESELPIQQEDLLVNLQDSKDIVLNLLEQFDALFVSTKHA